MEPALLINFTMSILIQKRHPDIGNLNSEASGDSESACLHCGDSLDVCLLCIIDYAVLAT